VTARKGKVGRPSLGAEARSVVWTIKVTPAMAVAIDAIAKRTKTRRAAKILEALELAIARGRR
jgi:predicted transcriptional regulator